MSKVHRVREVHYELRNGSEVITEIRCSDVMGGPWRPWSVAQVRTALGNQPDPDVFIVEEVVWSPVIAPQGGTDIQTKATGCVHSNLDHLPRY